jgi:hypothetical protein
MIANLEYSKRFMIPQRLNQPSILFGRAISPDEGPHIQIKQYTGSRSKWIAPAMPDTNIDS